MPPPNARYLGRSNRVVGLDLFRGLTIAAMILVNNPGDVDRAFLPLKHSAWHGCTFADIIFPFFLFIVGVSMNLSFASRREKRSPNSVIALGVLKRAAILVVIGMLLELLPRFHFSTWRLPGVLQRIGLAYAIAGLLALYLPRGLQLAWVVLALVGWWALLRFVPVPGFESQGPPWWNEPAATLAGHVDRLVLGRNHLLMPHDGFDPEGILATIPAAASVTIGSLFGGVIRRERDRFRAAGVLLVVGLAMLLAGRFLAPIMPRNKQLWTSTYVLYTSGLGACVLGLCLVAGERVRAGLGGWTRPWIALGKNAILLYMASVLLSKIVNHIHLGDATLPVRATDAVQSLVRSSGVASLLVSSIHVAIWVVVAIALDNRRLYWKI